VFLFDFSDTYKTYFIGKIQRSFKQVFIMPQFLCFIKVNTVLLFVKLAFGAVIFKFHTNSIPNNAIKVLKEGKLSKEKNIPPKREKKEGGVTL